MKESHGAPQVISEIATVGSFRLCRSVRLRTRKQGRDALVEKTIAVVMMTCRR